MAESGARRYDFLAAGVATFVSVLSLFVAGYSTYWQRQQTRAMTWPRLVGHSGGNTTGVGGFTLGYTNAGTGPLEMKTLTLAIDGAYVHKIPELYARLGALRGNPKDTSIDVSMSMIQTLGVGEKIDLLHVASEDVAKILISDIMVGKPHIVVSTCYCSLLDECWKSGGEAGARGVEVKSCPHDPNDILESF